MEQRMELLAPVGGMEQLKAALRFGADAVYGGMRRYGLRAFAGNFDLDELKVAADLAHRQGAKLYVTMNILPTDEDLPGFVEAAKDAAQAGADAAIVSDLGACLLLHERVPSLPIHVSTQANVLNSVTARHLHEAAGAERIVLSRELSLKDIAAMKKSLPPELELEAFVHGAMCVAYSGRCLLSAALTGRSGNRGACAQPCRWQYHLTEEKRPGEYLPVCEDDRGTYLYSAYDLCMLPYLPELKQAGIRSLKIEGRMKTAYYVASVVSVYRRALDLLELKGEAAYRQALPSLLEELQKVSHRASNTGFYFGAPSPAAGAVGFCQTMEYVGDVMEDAPEGTPALVKLKNRFFVGDPLEALTPKGSFPFTVTAMTLEETGEAVQTASVAGTLLRMPFPFPVSRGDLLRGPNRNHQS
ncbi:MAG: U32 family peptidase [Eubacteriales bacterium]|nr:U32 family peptidase [Eubacteriales bacterium]